MLRSVLVMASLMLATVAVAEPVFKIEVGRHRGKSDADMEKRIWELERAVWQLQKKVFHLENEKNEVTAETWLCSISAMGETYTGTGRTKATATHKAMESCKSSQKGNAFFCKSASCSQ